MQRSHADVAASSYASSSPVGHQFAVDWRFRSNSLPPANLISKWPAAASEPSAQWKRKKRAIPIAIGCTNANANVKKPNEMSNGGH